MRSGAGDRVGSDAVRGNPRPRSVTGIRLGDLAARLAVASPTSADPMVTGVTHASGEVRPGDLYAALPGARRPPTAGCRPWWWRPRAALGTLASAVYGDPTAGLTVIGVTGTAGKTSTAYLIESGLRAAGHVTGLIGTVETRLGDLVIDSVRTTPEATDLHAMLAAAAERGVTAVVMEVSSHALAMGRVGGVRFTVGGWTNFGSDHLDFHADAEDYFAAKARLFDGRCAVEVLNHDDPALKALFKPATVSFSALGDRAASWWADEQTGEGYAQRFTAHGPDGLALPARVALPGRHNVSNACWPSPAWWPPGSTRRRPPRACRLRRRVGVAGGCAGWSTTRTRPTPWWPRWPRCGNSAPAG